MGCIIRFDEAKDARGYNIRFGVAENKLYNSYQVYEKNEVLLTTLNADQDYYLAVDSFNENGIRKGDVVVKV